MDQRSIFILSNNLKYHKNYTEIGVTYQLVLPLRKILLNLPPLYAIL